MADYSSTYRIGITADTSQFMQQITKAFTDLKDLSESTDLAPHIREAAQAARELQQMLNNSMDWKNQRLDLTAFNQELTKSNKTVIDYAEQLGKAGTDGRAAFASMASAIVSAEMPLKRTNKLMDELWTTMKNTMRWQFTSSVMHGFVGALETAYGYSKSLDASLNNIRIVTSKSSDEMKDFARQANKAAKTLSTTTTEYTDAALIYYQQGLQDKEVVGRTNATIQLANVTGQDVTTTSEQLTAIWNNFYDGSKSLEYYVDVMAKLGATTASSSDEIATGVQKFASVANTIGLSYEYAASALATLTANTRESADIVGTALRTLFSRLQGLKLGETLDDGVDLNKYSEALHKVGVEVLDASGNLRDMDTILDDTAAKWDTLTNAQQMALAQTVAGVRQYTTFINLMENWKDFETNLATSKASEGTLAVQAEIYSQSWEGARNRVRAAAEDIYDSLINPDFYIGLDNYLEPILSFLADAIDGAGGLAGVLSTIITLMSKIYGDKIAKSMRDMVANIRSLESSDEQRARLLKEQVATQATAEYEAAVKIREQGSGGWKEVRGSDSNMVERLKVTQDIANAENKLAKEASSLTEHQVEELKNQIALMKQQLQHLEIWEQKSNAATRASNDSVQAVVGESRANNSWNGSLPASTSREGLQNDTLEAIKDLESRQLTGAEGEDKNTSKIHNNAEAIELLTQHVYKAITGREKYNRIVETYNKFSEEEKKDTEKVAKAIRSQAKELDILTEDLETRSDTSIIDYFIGDHDKTVANFEKTITEIKGLIMEIQDGPPEGTNAEDWKAQKEEQLNNMVEAFKREVITVGVFTDGIQKADEQVGQFNHGLDDGGAHIMDWADKITTTTTVLSAIVSVSTSLRSVIGSLADSDLSWTDKISQVIGALVTSAPAVITAYKTYNQLKEDAIARSIAMAETQGRENAQVTAGSLAHIASGAASTANAAGHTLLAKALGLVHKGILKIESALPILLVVSTVGVGLVALFQGISDAIANKNEKQLEDSTKVYESTKQELEQQQELIDTYKEAYKAYEETGKGKEALCEAANELADGLSMEKKNQELLKQTVIIANLTGNYKTLNKMLDEFKKNQANKALSNAKAGLDIASQKFKTDMKDGKGRTNLTGDKYSVSLGNSVSIASSSANEIIRNSDFYQNYDDVSGKFTFSSDPAEMAKAMTQARELLAAMQEAGDTSSTFYQDLLAWISKSDESYTEYMSHLDETTQASFEVALAQAGSTDNFETFEDYEAYLIKLDEALEEVNKDSAVNQEDLEALRDTYLSTTPALQEFALQQQMLTSLSDKFGIDFENNKDLKQGLLDSMGELDEDALSIAVSLIADSKSLDDFANKFSQKMVESMTESAIKSFEGMGEVLQDINDDHEFSDDSYETLQADTTFMDKVKEEFGSFEDFQRQSFSRQAEFVRDYYDDINYFAAKNLDLLASQAQEEYHIAEQKQLAMLELTEQYQNGESVYLARMATIRQNYNDAVAAGDQESINRAEQEWAKLQDEVSEKGIDISLFEIDNTENSLDELTNKLDEIQERIEDITKQKIDIAIQWDDLDDLKTQMDSLGDFATVMQREGTKVGDSYQYSLDAVREWMEAYPDLFDKAEATTDGLIQLNQAEVDDYIANQKKKVDTNTETKIKIWESEIDDLEVTKTKLLAEKTALINSANGEINIEQLTAEQKAGLIQDLTQYQVDAGVDASDAHAKALEAMSLDEEQYSSIVAEVGEKNTQNLTNSANESATNTIGAIQKMSAGVQNFGHNVLELGKAVAASIKDETYTPEWTNIEDYLGEGSEFKGAETKKEFKGSEGELIDPVEAFKTKKLEDIQIDLDAIDHAIATLQSKIKAAQAISKVDNAWEGTGGRDKDLKSESLNEILERYHEITREIEYQERVLDKLSTKADRAYGTDKLKLYGGQLEELSRLAELQGEKAQVALTFVTSDTQALEDLGLDIQVDEESLELTNYTALLDQAQQELEAFYTNYNSMTEDQRKDAEAAKKDAEKHYEDVKTALKNYEDSVDTYREETDNLEETLSKMEDIKLSEITYKFNLKLEVKDMKASLRDLEKSIAESWGNELISQKIKVDLDYQGALSEMNMLSTYEEQWNDLQQRLAEATTEADKQAIQDAMQDLFSEVEGSAETLIEWADTIEDIVPDAVSAAAEEFAKFTDGLDRNISVLEMVKELQTLQGVTAKTDAGLAVLQKNLQARLDAQTAQAALQKQWSDDFEARYNDAQSQLDTYLANGGSTASNEYDRLANMVDAYKEQWQEAEDAYLSLAKEAMETAQEMYLNELENAKAAFANSLTNGLGLDFLQTKYDNLIEEDERYFDAVNEAYEKASWYNKLQKDIDDSTNEAYTKQLKSLQDEINYRKEAGKLSEYDLSILEAKYNVLQAQMALEDARNAKNNLQLVRDSQGNWNYQYTADQDQIADAEQNLSDAQNEWYNLAKDRVEDITGEILSMWQECEDKIDDIYQQKLNGEITEEQYLAQLEEIERYYKEKSVYLEEEKQQAIEDINEAGYESLKTTLAGSGEAIDEFQSEYAEQLANMTAENANFEEKLDGYLGQCESSYQDYKDKVDSVARDTGTTQGALAEKTDAVTTATDNLRTAGELVVPVLQDQIDVAQELSDKYGENGLAGSIWEAIEAHRTMMREMYGQTSTNAGVYDADVDYSNVMANSVYGSQTYKDAMKFRQQKIDAGYDVGTANNERVDALLKKLSEENKTLKDLGYTYFSDISEEKWKELVGFDTGGYTGVFDDAKLAFLHEKELVLNQEDTANILAAVGMIRNLGPEFFASIEKALDGSVAASFGLMNDRLNVSNIQPIADKLEQDVHIEAVFPNVTDHNEIEEAFSSLTNDASQFIRRRKE